MRISITIEPHVPPTTLAAQRLAQLHHFISTNCFEVAGAAIAFAEFRTKFLAWLPKDERFVWTPYKLSRALRDSHPTGSMAQNKKYVANLSWTKDAGTTPLIVVEGNKRHGARRRLVRGI